MFLSDDKIVVQCSKGENPITKMPPKRKPNLTLFSESTIDTNKKDVGTSDSDLNGTSSGLSVQKDELKLKKVGLSINPPVQNHVDEDPAGVFDDIPPFMMDDFNSSKPNQSPNTSSSEANKTGMNYIGPFISPPTLTTLASKNQSLLPIRLLSAPSIAKPTLSPQQSESEEPTSTTSDIVPQSDAFEVNALRRPSLGVQAIKKKKNPRLQINLPIKNKVPGVGIDDEFTV